MILFDNKEEFKEIFIYGLHNRRYAISNFGRMISFIGRMEEGQWVKGSNNTGYKVLSYRIKQNNKLVAKQKFFCRLIAINFIPKPTEEHIHVLHLNHDKSNDHVDNLKWATKEEQMLHNRSNPRVIEAKFIAANGIHRLKGHKLTIAQVKLIKHLVFDTNHKTKMKNIAKRFGISEMQVYRIKSGENWAHVKIDD